MKIVIAGGTGHLGYLLIRHWQQQGHEVVVLSRGGRSEARVVSWDGRTLGGWQKEVDGAAVVVNLAGRTVNCRYTEENMKAMMDSRVDSTRVIGEAIAQAAKPPRLWLQMSTATIYSHRFDRANDEHTGVIGGNEPDVPAYWKFSVDIGHAWEKTQEEANTPHTRKVAMRTAMVMGPEKETVFDVLAKMTRLGLGGSIAGGHQYMSWIHESDFVQAVEFLIHHEEIKGAVNFCAPDPLPQKEFMREMRKNLGVPIGLPAAKWMVEIGAVVMKTDTELLLKSRRVVPARLLDAGFQFRFPNWSAACADLSKRWLTKA